MKTEARRIRSWHTGVVLLWLAFAPLAQAFYKPSAGRWLNRDRIGENGGQNLYCFVENSAPNQVDIAGMKGAGMIGGMNLSNWKIVIEATAEAEGLALTQLQASAAMTAALAALVTPVLPKPCPGTDSVRLYDTPAIPVNANPRTAHFRITVFNPPGCACSRPSITLQVTQYLYPPITQEFFPH